MKPENIKTASELLDFYERLLSFKKQIVSESFTSVSLTVRTGPGRGESYSVTIPASCIEPMILIDDIDKKTLEKLSLLGVDICLTK